GRSSIATLVVAVSFLVAPTGSAGATAGDPLKYLPVGPAPSVPYGIGETLYGYRTHVIPASWTWSDHFYLNVVASRGVVWAGVPLSATDCGTGLLVWRSATQRPVYVAATGPACIPIAVTTGGLGIVPGNVAAYTSSGTKYATYPQTLPPDGTCGAGNSSFDSVDAAGARVVVFEGDCDVTGNT